MTFLDRIKQTSTSTGTGNFTLSGAVTGYKVFSNGTYKYCIVNATETEWEVGEGTVASGVLTRTTIEASSNGGAVVNFTAGTKQVFNTVSATYVNSLVPYTGATASVNLGAYNITATNIIRAGGLATEFLKADGSVDSTTYMNRAIYDTDGNGVVDAAEKMQTIGRNSTGATLYKGTIVYISGSTGNRPNFVKAQANSEATSAGTFGVVVSDIANNSDGYVATIGTLSDLDTRTTAINPFTSVTLADGDTIYLDPNTAGYVTNVKPSAPNHIVYVGKVVRTSPTLGTIVYRIQNGYELSEIHDVSISSVANNDVLVYESSSTLWKNKSIATILGYTPQAAITLTTTGSSGASTFISNTLNIPTYTLAGLGGISLTSLSATAPISYNNTTGVFSIVQATASVNGYLSSTDWTTFNNKQAAITLTTTGTSGAATFASNTLNIPQYQGALTLTTTGTSGAATLVGNTLNIPQYAAGITGSGTAGQLTYWSGTSAVTGSSNLVWNNTNNQFSIKTENTSTADRGISSEQYNNGIQGAVLQFKKARGTIASPLNVNANDILGAFSFNARVGGTFTSDRSLFGAMMTSSSGIGLFFNTGSSDGIYTPNLFIHPSGNVGINPGGSIISSPPSDGGQRLQVIGSMRVGTTAASAMYWDDTNNRLGIGTSSPGFIVDIQGNTNGFVRQHIKNSSNGTLATTAILLRNDVDMQYMFGICSSGFTTVNNVQLGDAFVQQNDILGSYPSSSLVLRTSNANAIKLQTNSTTRMTIKADGKINISSLPTSSAGLSTGDLWNNLGIVSIV